MPFPDRHEQESNRYIFAIVCASLGGEIRYLHREGKVLDIRPFRHLGKRPLLAVNTGNKLIFSFAHTSHDGLIRDLVSSGEKFDNIADPLTAPRIAMHFGVNRRLKKLVIEQRQKRNYRSIITRVLRAIPRIYHPVKPEDLAIEYFQD